MAKSPQRVARAAADAGLDIEVVTLPASTRTAREAADACGCSVGQIVKSLVFEGARSGALKLLLVSGDHDVDLTRAEALFGEALQRADPRRVRDETGFAIGGVAPIGHLCAIDTWMDDHLMTFDTIWAAAGAPNAVFRTTPQQLQHATGAKMFGNSASR